MEIKLREIEDSTLMFMSFNARACGLELTASETIELAADAGFGGVDLMVRDLIDSGDDPRRLRTRMDDRRLQGGAFPLPVHWRGSAETFKRDLESLARYAEAAAVLGLLRTGTWVMPETPEPTGRGEAIDQAEVVALHRDRLGKIARVLDRFGVRLGLEVIGVASSRTGRGRPFVCRFADLDRVLGVVWNEAPNLGVILDAWHLYAAGDSVEDGLTRGVERVIWVHVADLPSSAPADRLQMKDLERGLPGEHGAIDLRQFLARLKDAGYDGPVTAEPMGRCPALSGIPPVEAIHRVAKALWSVWPRKADDLQGA